MEKYFIGFIGSSSEAIAFKMKRKEISIKEIYDRIGITIYFYSEEVKKGVYDNWKGIKIEIQ